jgi:hypothetical protein
MNTGWPQRVLCTIVAMFVVMGPVLVCAPAGAASLEHCTPAQHDASNHCRHSQSIDCCATSSPQAPSAPQETPSQQQNTRASASGPVAQADVVAVLDALHSPSLSRTVRRAPLHGYRSTDLPTLNAAFLI